jgi:non-ribosomal peptide synthetase-like protein
VFGRSEVLAAGPAEPSTIQGGYAGSATSTETSLAEVLAEIMHGERVPVESNFFDGLGADSMVMAHFCARVRKRADLPSVSMKDIYRYQTIKSLATALADTAPSPAESSAPEPAERAALATTWQYVVCGILQFLTFVAYSSLTAVVTQRGYDWVSAGPTMLDVYLRSVIFGGSGFLGLCILPIVAKWTLIGRWKPQQIRIWTLPYFRFWVVKTLIRANPLLLLIGGRSRTSTTSPLYVLYLKALGAKIGRGVAIYSRNMPVCTDLLAIGDGAVIRKDSYFNCYRAHSGLIQTGPVTLGKDALVGEMTVLDINTSIGAGAQLGHASSLQAGRAVPDGERWNGSPAQRADVDYRVGPAACGTLRRASFALLQMLNVLFVYVPLIIGGLVLVLVGTPQLNALVNSRPLVLTHWPFYQDALITSAVIFFGFMLVSLCVVLTVPRVLNLALKPDKVYRLYGFHFWVHRTIARLTNARFFNSLFGDSAYIVHYLRCLGYKLSPVVQTGSNFGSDVKHENPYLSSVGSGTMVADGLSIINADFSSTSFRVTRASIGAYNFIGNVVPYPAQSKTRDNCLLATKLMVPVEGKVRDNTGLLGSPSFEIPRSVQRDGRFDHLRHGDELRRRLAAKSRYNLRTMGLSLLVRWFYVFGVTLIGWTTVDLYNPFGAVAIAVGTFITFLFSMVYLAMVERIVTLLRGLRPQYCSIYEPYFWWHERYWKLSVQPRLLDGTPFKNLLWRLLGVRIGKRVFDDGAVIIEKSMVTVGDDCTLNAGSRMQCHSQEDGAFKSDSITIGAGCTVGTSSLVHYGATMGDGAELGPDSFLMKGEEIPRRGRWVGNPAREIRTEHHQPALTQ